MAKKTSTQTATLWREKPKRKRPGVHAKTKTSSIKGSKNYKKPNVGQG
jgi:hypothetical protein